MELESSKNTFFLTENVNIILIFSALFMSVKASSADFYRPAETSVGLQFSLCSFI